MRWQLLVFKLASEPSRHRVAVWRALRRTGAVSLGQSLWVVPATRAFADGVAKAAELVVRGGGEPLVFEVVANDEDGAASLARLYTAAREAEWREFLDECGRYEAELDKEVATEKFTLAELDEEEQSMERLRRWYRELRVRDVLGAPSAGSGEDRLRACEERLEAYTELVFRAAHASPER